MGLLKTSASGLVPPCKAATICSISDISVLTGRTGVFKSSVDVYRRQFYFKKPDQVRPLGVLMRLRAIKCFHPVATKKYFAGYLGKCQRENGGLTVVESFNNQIQGTTHLSAASLPEWKNPDTTIGDLGLLIKEVHFIPPARRTKFASWVCLAKGPRQRKPRVWKSKTRIGTVSKAQKLVQHVKALSNVKEEVYGALDSFIAWEVEFPLITVKKCLKTLQAEKEWKRIIQITKWMLSKGQGKTMGNYYLLLNALAEEQRIQEAEELWNQIFKRHLEYIPKMFFTRVITMYEQNNMTDKLLEVFGDMEELGVKPDNLVVTIVANTFKKLNMLDKYERVLNKYPEPEWVYRTHNGKPYRVRVQKSQNYVEDMIHQNSNGSNDIEEHESARADFPTTEDAGQSNEVSGSFDKRDPTRVPITI